MEQSISKQTKPKPIGFARRLLLLTAAGDAAFWATSVLTSLLPIAAEYRAALSNWRVELVWIGSLLMGIPIGLFVGGRLLKTLKKSPGGKPILRAVALSLLALLVAILLIDLPMFLRSAGTPIRYFWLGVGFNLVRFLVLGFVIGAIEQGRDRLNKV